jgi:uncharacterized protein (DUF488 family)
MSPKIFTIGYGNRSIQSFIQLLKKFEIDLLIDVRSVPQSRYLPDYNSKRLELHLVNHQLSYLFLGKELGGRPSDPSCYTEGKVDYDKIVSKLFFIKGIEEVQNMNNDGLTVAVMCAEQSPIHCHRKLLIGDYLHGEGYEILHIDKDGSILNELF